MFKADRRKPTALVMVNTQDFMAMAFSMIEYSMGRQTYMVEWSQEIVLKQIQFIDNASVTVLLRIVTDRIKRAEEMNAPLGSRSDHDSWCRFRQQLVASLAAGEV